MMVKRLFYISFVSALVLTAAHGKADPEERKTNNPDVLRQAAMIGAGNPEAGKEVFISEAAKCATCHKVGGQGGNAGPELSQIGGKLDRTHLIESILQPSLEILEGYHSTVIETRSGGVVTGLLRSESPLNLSLVDAEGKRVVVAHDDIARRELSKTSLMPADLVARMTPPEFNDLIAYLTTLRTGRGAHAGRRHHWSAAAAAWL